MTSSKTLDQLSLGLLFTYLLLRFTVAAVDPVWGTNLLIHALVWPAAALWCLARLLEGRTPVRVTGLEIPLAAWCVLCVISIQRAPFKLAAIDSAAAFISLAALVPIIVHVAGNDSRRLLTTFFHATTGAIAVYSLVQVWIILPILRESEEAKKFIAAMGSEQSEFVIRLKGNQPWGTFISPNSLAGFLVLALPFAAGSIVDGLRAKVPPFFTATRAVTVIAGLIALALTGSKGGWGAMGAAVVVAGVLVLAHRKPEKRRLIIGVGLAAAALGLAGGWAYTAGNSKSMQFRVEYSKAAIAAFKTEPVMGIGLGQYADAQPRFKGDLQQEANKVHNDYLQILCELGILGLLAFLAILGMTMRHALAANGVPSPKTTSSCLPAVIGAGVALLIGLAIRQDRWLLFVFTPMLLWLLFEFTPMLIWAFARVTRPSAAPTVVPVLKTEFSWLPAVVGACVALLIGLTMREDLWLVIVFTPVWFAAFFMTARHESEEPLFSRLGLTAGFVGLLVHLTVDFDLYEYGVAAALFTAIALLVLHAKSFDAPPGGRLPALAGAALSIVIVIPMTWGAMRFQSAEEHLASARESAGSQRADDELLAALAANPFDPGIAASLAANSMIAWRGHRMKMDFTQPSLQDILLVENQVLSAWQRALKLRAEHAPYYYAAGQTHEEMARFYQEASQKNRNPELPGRARLHLMDAEDCYRKALALYPTRAATNVALARLLDALGKEDYALPYYAAALKYSNLAADTKRLELEPYDRARAICRTGIADDRAVGDLANVVSAILLAKMTEGSKPNLDELLTVIDDVRRNPTKYWPDFHRSMESALSRAAVDLMERVRKNAEELEKKVEESKKGTPPK